MLLRVASIIINGIESKYETIRTNQGLYEKISTLSHDKTSQAILVAYFETNI